MERSKDRIVTYGWNFAVSFQMLERHMCVCTANSKTKTEIEEEIVGFQPYIFSLRKRGMYAAHKSAYLSPSSCLLLPPPV
jgi:hypothetical protein